MVPLKKPSYSWWFDSHNSPRSSTWLQSTLTDLDKKTKAMLKLIEEDADSFAQRAEMYYKKRPELVTMVEDFYRAHRSLAERYEQLKSETGTRLTSPLRSLFSTKTHKLINQSDKSSETSYCFDSEESEVDDPEQEETQVDGDMEEEDSIEDSANEVTKLREELERQKEDNRNQVDRELKLREEIQRLKWESKILKEELMEKDEKKREVIRQLGLAIEIIKEENACLKKYIKGSKKRNLLEMNKWKGIFSGKLFSGFSKFQPSIVAL